MPDGLTVERVPIGALRAHPRNYRGHPESQRAHIRASLREHGFYRNIVVAEDLTILAGHGVWLAAKEEGLAEVPVIRLPVHPDSAAATRVLVGDNEIATGADMDDRMLVELLKTVRDSEGIEALLGTGFSAEQLAALAFVTRPPDQVAGTDEHDEWVGMPEYESLLDTWHVTVHFRSAEDRTAFFAMLGQPATDRTATIWWPARDRRTEPVAPMRGVGHMVEARPADFAAAVNGPPDGTPALDDDVMDPVDDGDVAADFDAVMPPAGTQP